MAEAIVAKIAGAAFASTTAGLLATTAVSVGLSLVTSWAVAALTPQPPTPKQSILVNARDAAAAQDIVYGEVRKGGTITYYESTRKGSVLHQIIVLAGHEVDEIVEVYANDEVLELSDDSYDFNGRTGAGWVLNRNWIDKDDGPEMRVLYHTGDQTAITDPFANATTTSLNDTLFEASDEGSANFGGAGQPTKESFVGTGIAYLYIRYSYNAGVFKNGLPLFTARIKGKKVYDPRSATTAWSDNAALCIRDYITSAVGLNDPQVYDTVFAASANACDELVALAAGGTEKRYTINGVVRTDQSYGDVLQEMTTACAGTLFWGTGKWKLQVGVYNAPVKTFTLDDIRSNITLQTRVNLRDQFNTVQGVFTDAANGFIPADYPPLQSSAFKAQDNDVEQVLDLNLPFTTSSAAAQRLAKLTLFRGREQMTFSADFGLSAFEVEVGDIVALTMDRYGWTAKEFEVVGWVFGTGDNGALRITLTLRETSEAAFDWDAEETEIIANDSSLTSDIDAVTGLAAVRGGRVATDGTFINGITVSWNAVEAAAGYAVEWMVNTSIDYAANGGLIEPDDVITSRDLLVYNAYIEILYRQPDGDGFAFYTTGGGSWQTEQEVRAALYNSSERAALVFSGLRVPAPTTTYTIEPVQDTTEYLIRVRALNEFGDSSVWKAVNFSSLSDDTTPNAPTSLTATGGYRTVRLAWTAPSTNTDSSDLTDLALYNIYRGTSTNPTTKVGSTAGEGWTDSGLDDDTTYHYRVTAVDFTGNESAYSNNASTATNPELVDGADGTSVLVVYAEDALGNNQSLSVGTRRYVQYVEYTGTAPSLPVGGTFVLFVGDDGPAGQSIWPIYADDAAGNGQSFDSAGKLYVTFYEATTQPTLPVTGQTFVLFVGEDGGTGQSVWPIYADDTAGNGQSFDSTGKLYVTFYEATTQPTLPVTGQTFIRYVGADGLPGERGSGRWYIDVDGRHDIAASPITEAEAVTEWNFASGANSIPLRPQVYDQVIFYNGTEASPTRQQAFICDSVTSDTVHTWVEQTALIDGSLLVTGTVTADSLVVGDTTGGILINDSASGTDDAVYIYQNDLDTYGLYVKNAFSALAGAGGAAYIESQAGFALQVKQNLSGAGNRAIDAQNALPGGGATRIGVSFTDGGYGVDVIRGGYYDTSGDGYGPFTGVHEGYLHKDTVATPGDILCDTQVLSVSVSDSITVMDLCAEQNDRRVIGVYAGTKGPDYVPTALVDVVDGEKVPKDVVDTLGDYRVISVNSVGEGGVLVCGENGDIASGDLIVASSLPGKGMKQTDDIVRSYTVAKAREDVTFSGPSDIKMVACIYLCG